MDILFWLFLDLSGNAPNVFSFNMTLTVRLPYNALIVLEL